MLAAGDTFRAAAREQLIAWGARNDVPVIAQTAATRGRSCSMRSAPHARRIDVLIADTAGRLPTQLHLMEEIRKVKRVAAKALDGAPHEVVLVLDANTGQNSLAQVKAFDDALGLTGLILTKLDGTAKGGVVFAIAKEKPIAVAFIGVGKASATCGRSPRATSPRRWLVSFSAVAKRYPGGLEALKNVSFSLQAGELAFLTGRSGAGGKSTLLKLIPADRASERRFGGGERPECRLAQARRGAVICAAVSALVFQDQKLLYDRSVYDNVMLPLAFSAHAPEGRGAPRARRAR